MSCPVQSRRFAGAVVGACRAHGVRGSISLCLSLFGALAHAGLGPAQLAVVINDADPLSVKVGAYYQQARAIPTSQMIHVRFAGGRPALDPVEFARLRTAILSATPAWVQAYALTWAQPYRVDCMGITSALTFGFNRDWCSRGPVCSPTRASPLYDHDTSAPFGNMGLRPSMMLAATRFDDAKALIDRGVRADHSRPHGSAYLMVTGEAARTTPRLRGFALAQRLSTPGLAIRVLKADRLVSKNDILFYLTGFGGTEKFDALEFLPGAVADHLTSFGGMLTDSPQMSALRWLEAGATGSYGTVREPCAYPQKFPDAAVLIRRYTRGETLIEAYWKSVSSPGEGVFIGEPLAAPWN